MWPFKKRNITDEVRGLKRIKVRGMRFVIKKLNPFLDFKDDRMPQIFTDHKPMRPADPNQPPDKNQMDRMYRDMMSVVDAGVVEIVGYGPMEKGGITVEDLFRDSEMGFQLYMQIIDHSLNRFKGLKGVFFSAKTRLSTYILSRIVTDTAHRKLCLDLGKRP